MDDVLCWSEGMDKIFHDCVMMPVFNHPRTDFTDDMRLGFPFTLIREEVIAKGLADFRTGYSHPVYGDLTADDKVLLYSFINFKKHFYACRQTFETHRTDLARWCDAALPVAIDLGCGPGTAGLALADTYPGMNWEYVGVDLAPGMRRKAKELLGAAKHAGLLGPNSRGFLYESWGECGVDKVPPSTPLLVICSYLFANASLTTEVLRALADWLRSVCQVAERPVAMLVYLNSTNPYANTNYEYFKTLLGLDPLAHKPTRGEVKFRKNRSGSAVGSDEFLHELLILKEG